MISQGMMHGGAMMWGMGLIGLLAVTALVLLVGALAKHLVAALPRHAANRSDEFFDFLPLINHIARREGVGDAMRDMIAQHLLLDLV